MANFTEVGIVTSTPIQVTILPAGLGVFLFAINIFLSFAAFLGNALILLALRKVSSLHPPSKLLFGCLAVTDLGVGPILQPLLAIYILRYVKEINWNINYFFLLKICRASSLILCGVSLFTSTAISVDRVVALLLGLRYRHFVTFRRVCAVISCFWLTAVSVTFMHLFLSFAVAVTAAVILAVLSVVISVFSYTKIFLTLRQQQAQVQAHVRGQPDLGGMPLNIARYKKTVSTIGWVQITLVACYVPVVISAIVAKQLGFSETFVKISFNSATTVLYLNSSLNPLLYLLKIGEVRQALKLMIRQSSCCSSYM